MKRKQYHGWILLEKRVGGVDEVFAEYENAGGKRDRKGFGFGNTGCAEAIKWWDKRLGGEGLTKLDPTLNGMYRVFTEAVEPTAVWVLESFSSDMNWELVDVFDSLESARKDLGDDLIWIVQGDDLSAVTVHDDPAYYITRKEVKS